MKGKVAHGRPPFGRKPVLQTSPCRTACRVSGGVANVNDSITSYRDCNVHDNAGAAFYFSGNSHSVSDTLIFNQSKDFSVQRGTEVKRERIDWRHPR